MSYRVVATSRFERDFKALAKRHPQVIRRVEAMVEVVSKDPYNRSQRHNIKKLKGVKKGEGQWRIASGEYRIRYDIFGDEVVLYSCKPRRAAYQTG